MSDDFGDTLAYLTLQAKDEPYKPPKIYDSPRSTHIGWYLHPDTKRNIMRYMFKHGLASPVHNNVSPHDMHATLLYHGALRLPTDHQKHIDMNHDPVVIHGPMKVKATNMHGSLYSHGDPVNIMLPEEFARIKARSDKLHKRYNLTPNPSHYKHHVMISRVQIHPQHTKAFAASKFKTLQDYSKLPPIDFPLMFTSEETTHRK